MTDIDAVRDFIKFISTHSEKDALGTISIDPALIRNLVNGDPDTAILVVELYCKMRKNDPDSTQFAWIIARTYEDLFDDDVLMLTVQKAQNTPGPKPLPRPDSGPVPGKIP